MPPLQPATRRGRLPPVSDDRVGVRTGANGVATVTMARSDKHNALDQAMFEGLMNAAEQLANDASVRAVVLHGEGKSFCSGLDIASFMSGGGGTGVLLARDDDRLANFAQRVTYDWSLVSAPVIAAIHGNCFAAVCRSRSVPTSGSPRRTRSCASWRSSGASYPIWASRRHCRGSYQSTSRKN